MVQNTIAHAFKTKLHCQIIKLCHSLELPLHTNHKGPKLFTEYQRISLLILWKRSCKSVRDFVKLLPEQKWIDWLGLKHLPSKSVIHSWLKRIPAKTLRLFNSLILKDEKPSLMAIDGTGIDSWQRSRHYEKRIGDPNMPYAKLDILIDTKTLLIHDHILQMKPRHDVIAAESIFHRTKLKGIKILGDKGYDSEPLHKIAAEKGNKLYAPVRKSSRKKPKGFHRRQCAKGDEDYPQRNTVESTFHSLKSIRVNALKCKKHFMKKREMAWHILIYNLERINKIKALIKWLLTQPFWTLPKMHIFYKVTAKNPEQ